MKIRVNLLKQEELRHAGGVIKQFAIRAGASTGATLLLLIIVIWAFQHHALMKDLKWAKSEWNSIESTYEKVAKIQDNFNKRRQTVAELKKWEEARIQWNTPFNHLREVIPETVQLTKLSIRSRMDIEEPDKEGGEFSVTRNYQIMLNGKAMGEMGDEVMLQLVRNLKDSEKFKELLKTVQLKKLQRDTFDQQSRQASLFFIEGVFHPRKIK